MKIIKELELRRSLLLELREDISLKSPSFSMDTLKQIDLLLSQIEFKIIQVCKNKLFFYDNDEAFVSFIAGIDDNIEYLKLCCN